jgi:hypothetical protein
MADPTRSFPSDAAHASGWKGKAFAAASAVAKAGQSWRDKYPVLFLALFLGLLLLPLRGFPGNFSDFSTQFWGYEELVRGYTNVRFSLLKDQIFGDIFARPDGWLVYTGETSMDNYQRTDAFTPQQLATIQTNLDGLTERLGQHGIKFLVVIVPGKNTIYPEEVPPQIPVLGDETRTDQLMAYLSQNSKTSVLDLRAALLAARKDHVLYYATDTHWNPYGILVGYQQILGALQKDFPSLKAHTLDDFRVASRGQGSGDISREWVQGLAQEEMFRLEPRFERKTEQFALSQGSSLVPGRMIATYTPDDTLPKAMIFHDSFFNDMIPFLSDHFRYAIYHWAFKVDETFVAGEKPDIVIFEVTDRYLSRLLDLTKK